MNIIIIYGIYLIISGGLGFAATAYVSDFLNWQITASFLTTISGITAAMFALGVIAIPLGVFLGAVSDSKPKNPSPLFFIGSLTGTVISIGLALFSIYLDLPGVDGHELFIVACRFISIVGLFASPLCLIRGYLLKTKEGRSKSSNETNI